MSSGDGHAPRTGLANELWHLDDDDVAEIFDDDDTEGDR